MNLFIFVKNFTNKFKYFQDTVLSFLENENDDKIHIQNIIAFFEKERIHQNKHELKIILHLISRLSDNYRRSSYFFNKIEQILNINKDSIQKHFSNQEIFDIFKANKRVLMFLFNEKFIVPDRSIYCIISNSKYRRRNYPQYFFNEFNYFFDKYLWREIKIRYSNLYKLVENDNEQYEHNKTKGENEDDICLLIQNDSINEFIEFVNKNNVPLTNRIKPSIFETNLLFLKKRATLIEYSAFYGSIQIFKYLFMNGVNLSESLWCYAIHSRNTEIIHILEDNHIEISDEIYDDCYTESIKCHHNDITNYIKNSHIRSRREKLLKYLTINLKFYNFIEISEIINELKDDAIFCSMNIDKIFNIFCSFCKYDYFLLCEYILKNMKININMKQTILEYSFWMKLIFYIE